MTQDPAATGWLTVADVAGRSGRTPEEVRAAVVRREVSAVSTHPQARGDWMFRVADVERWLAKLSPFDPEQRGSRSGRAGATSTGGGAAGPGPC